MSEPAFEIVNRTTRHRRAIYADGHVEGFEDDVYVVNRIPLLMSSAAAIGDHDRRASFDRWLQAQNMIGIGIHLYGALYLIMVFVASVIEHAPLARYIVIASAGASYFGYVAQYHGRKPEMTETVIVIASVALGIAAGLALLFGV